MNQVLNATFRLSGAISCSLLIASTHADLQPIDDAELDALVGQAYVEMDSYLDNTTKYSRITFGENIKIQANADKIELGRYDRTGETLAADISLTNVGFGYIDTATNEIVPFEVNNPFFEWAIDETTKDILGFRIGFEEASGIFQANIHSFTGHIGAQFNDGNTGSLLDSSGNVDAIRSNLFGVEASNCSGGSNACAYDIQNFRSFSVADADGSSTSDFFISVQSQNLTWKWGDSVNGETSSYATTKGFFMNIPTNNNAIEINGSATGTQGFTTEFIDRGVGRWF